MIRQKSYRVKEITDALKGIVLKSSDPNDIGDIMLLSARDITEIIRGLKVHNPQLVELIKNSKDQFPRDWKFPIRHILITMAYAMAKGEDINGKLHQL